MTTSYANTCEAFSEGGRPGRAEPGNCWLVVPLKALHVYSSIALCKTWNGRGIIMKYNFLSLSLFGVVGWQRKSNIRTKMLREISCTRRYDIISYLNVSTHDARAHLGGVNAQSRRRQPHNHGCHLLRSPGNKNKKTYINTHKKICIGSLTIIFWPDQGLLKSGTKSKMK